MTLWPSEWLSSAFFLISSLFTAFCFHILPVNLRKKKSIKGKLVLITGAGGCIGRELAREFATQGANLLLWDVVQAANLETAKICQQLGVQAYCQTVDVGDRQAIYTAADEIQQHTDGNFTAEDVDILVNNAGIINSGSFLETEDARIERLIRINLFQSLWTTKVFLPKMLKRGSGHIVVTASAASFFGIPGLVDYGTSKAAVFNFIQGIENEIVISDPGKDIYFTCLCPSFVATPLVDNISFARSFELLAPSDVAKKSIEAIQLNRSVVMMPEWVSRKVALKGILPSNFFKFMMFNTKIPYS